MSTEDLGPYLAKARELRLGCATPEEKLARISPAARALAAVPGWQRGTRTNGGAGP